MDRIEDIVSTIEDNSKKMKEYSFKIQELNEKLDNVKHQIKWAPTSELDEKMKKEKDYLRRDAIGFITIFAPSATDSAIKNSRVEELKKKKEQIQGQLEYYTYAREKLRNENLNLRLELEEIKKKKQ